jgi:hypothetical protein
VTSDSDFSADGSKTCRQLGFRETLFGCSNRLVKGNVLDKTSVWLYNDHRWLWWKRGDDRDDVRYQKTNFSKKAMIFAQISKRWRKPIVTVAGTTGASAIVMSGVYRKSQIFSGRGKRLAQASHIVEVVM